MITNPLSLEIELIYMASKTIQYKPQYRALMISIGNSLKPSNKKSAAKQFYTVTLYLWLDNPPPNYPATWQRLIDLLEDSDLGEVATELRIEYRYRSVSGSLWILLHK